MTGIYKQTEEILRTWLHNVGFDLQQAVRPFHTKLYAELEEWIISQDLQEHQLSRIWMLLPASTSAADKWYPQASYQLKRYIALFTTFLLYVDDKAEQDLEHILPDLQRVSSGACNGLHALKCDDTVFNMWLELVATETGTFYGSYSTGVITKGLVDFMLGNTVESNVAAGLKVPAKFGQRGSKFVRDKTGAGEVYAHFIFPEHLAEENRHLPTYVPFIACMLDIIDDVNDILSFFKESVVGTEMNTNIMNRARTSCCSPHDVLKQICSETVEAMHVVSHAFEEKGVVGKLWKDFINGYIMWHICEDRYRLKEIGLAMRLGQDRV
ncbi:isoprenoid synthase domain-containing protein [Penicillium soppii]|uniref:isoprenoid synthase domain-containing protein n=1 Tax=Penicillium soppii TaxID=69789 RepID=UPI0025472D47|nr:isoprenoid synthase domain-containing protein [Penicillium soppii]KAJ5876181.1 isoprenoid synthase domain-containing protein [Penicillium soppii]